MNATPMTLTPSPSLGHEATISVMRVPLTILIIGVLCTVAFANAAYLANEYLGDPLQHEVWAVNSLYVIAFMGMTALGLSLIATYFVERHEIREEKFVYRLLMNQGIIKWNEIIKVKYSPSHKWFHLEGFEGEIIRVSVALSGTQEFAQAVLDKVSPTSIDGPMTRNILEALAEGTKISIWG